uniref:Uncharacterized protein n=1 Tax=Spongospora subterranea TaxID=70186 RepID=A0A0H5R969_9EUKA|eukprot:CRZ10296.1 hypothetical protein [Spongospora subterranea]
MRAVLLLIVFIFCITCALGTNSKAPLKAELIDQREGVREPSFKRPRFHLQGQSLDSSSSFFDNLYRTPNHNSIADLFPSSFRHGDGFPIQSRNSGQTSRSFWSGASSSKSSQLATVSYHPHGLHSKIADRAVAHMRTWFDPLLQLVGCNSFKIFTSFVAYIGFKNIVRQMALTCAQSLSDILLPCSRTVSGDVLGGLFVKTFDDLLQGVSLRTPENLIVELQMIQSSFFDNLFHIPMVMSHQTPSSLPSIADHAFAYIRTWFYLLQELTMCNRDEMLSRANAHVDVKKVVLSMASKFSQTLSVILRPWSRVVSDDSLKIYFAHIFDSKLKEVIWQTPENITAELQNIESSFFDDLPLRPSIMSDRSLSSLFDIADQASALVRTWFYPLQELAMRSGGAISSRFDEYRLAMDSVRKMGTTSAEILSDILQPWSCRVVGALLEQYFVKTFDAILVKVVSQAPENIMVELQNIRRSFVDNLPLLPMIASGCSRFCLQDILALT